MSLEVLAKADENLWARAEIRHRGVDLITPWFRRILHRTGIVSGVNVGMLEKSWDVLRTLQFIEQHVSKATPILDLGAYSSELLCILHKMGFSALVGIDLNQALHRMPYNQSIKYVIGDFTQSTFPAETFGVVTAISVIEHGFCAPKVLREVSRVLKTGGYFIGSTDYWPEKINTQGMAAFGLDWTIFSRDELSNLITEAGTYGLVPTGRLNFEASEKAIRWLKKQYTFAWFVFQKRAHIDFP